MLHITVLFVSTWYLESILQIHPFKWICFRPSKVFESNRNGPVLMLYGKIFPRTIKTWIIFENVIGKISKIRLFDSIIPTIADFSQSDLLFYWADKLPFSINCRITENVMSICNSSFWKREKMWVLSTINILISPD